MTAEVWRIGAAEMVDNYRQPAAPGPGRWRLAQGGLADPAQRWPLFHPSEADPDAGYRLYPYMLEFELPAAHALAYELRVSYLAIAPRIGQLEVAVNGVAGRFYLRPAPSGSDEVRLHAALHTPLYGEGELAAVLPGALLRAGANTLTLTCHDGAPVEPVGNPEKIKRLDRMATGAGFIYQSLALVALDAAPPAVGAVTLTPTVFYRRDAAGGVTERCDLHITYNAPAPAGQWRLVVQSPGGPQAFTLDLPAVPFGAAQHSVAVPVEGEAPLAYTLTSPAGFEQRGELAPRRKWTVYVTPHLHTDIGYTHRQWEVAERLSRNLDAALDAATPYHVDAAWVLDHYTATRGPARQAQLAAALRAGLVGVPGNHVILLSHLAALEDLVRNTTLAAEPLRPLELRPRFAAVVDVPSLTSALPDVLAGAGVRYLVHASNQDRGPFRVNGGLHRRSPFYWRGPSGGRVLVWLSKMYCELRKVCGSPPDLAAAERGLGLWLQEFERPGYAPDTVLLYGQEADNTDLDPQPAQFVAEWNAAYAYPRLVPCAVEAFFEAVEARYSADCETVTGDGGAYWEDGAGSTLAETTLARQAQADLPAAERLAALAALHQPGLAYPLAEFDEAWRSLLLFDEHTWGAFLSGTDPAARLQRDQWAVKAHFARDAAQWGERLLHGAATRHSLAWNAAGREVAVYNPHSWAAGGQVTVEVAGGERVVADTGAPVPQRVVSATATQAVIEFQVEALAGLSFRRYGLVAGAELSAPQPLPAAGGEVVLESAHYRVTVALERGAVVSWFDKALGRELVDRADEWGLGQLLYASGGAGTRLLSNQADLPEADPAVSGVFRLDTWGAEVDAVGQRLWLRGVSAAGPVRLEWTLPHHTRALDLSVTLDKEAVREPEAVYVAFPLALPGARVRSDAQLGWVDWNADRLPGACQEWLPLQSAVLADLPGAAVCVASPDVPLFTVGAVVRGRWPKTSDLSGGRLFSYVLNNYWRTNYFVGQAGALTFRYALTSAAEIAPAEAYRFGWGTRRPLYAQRLSLQEFRAAAGPYAAPGGGPLAQVTPEEVVVSTLSAARWGAGWVVRLQEIGGAARTATLALPGRRLTRAWRTDLLEYDEAELPITGGVLTVEVPAWGLRTVRLEVAP